MVRKGSGRTRIPAVNHTSSQVYFKTLVCRRRISAQKAAKRTKPKHEPCRGWRNANTYRRHHLEEMHLHDLEAEL